MYSAGGNTLMLWVCITILQRDVATFVRAHLYPVARLPPSCCGEPENVGHSYTCTSGLASPVSLRMRDTAHSYTCTAVSYLNHQFQVFPFLW